MDGNLDNPIQITSSPPSSIPGTPVGTSKTGYGEVKIMKEFV
jgi:hypothetical protein